MAPTIQISKTAQKRLLKIMNEMEKNKGARVAYNDAILLLLDKISPHDPPKDLISHIARFEGIIDIGKAREILVKERQKDGSFTRI
ncbi:MAG: hypothetical protein ACTSYI_03505 [Promethearchaeota archaeon]